MSAAETAIEYDPEWEPPDEEELSEVSVEKKFFDKVKKFHTGLKSIAIKAVWKNEDNETLTQPVLSIKVKNGGTNKIPGISPTMLAQVITARANEHALEKEAIVKYKVNFYGSNDDLGGTFQKQGSFSMDGVPDEDEDADEEEEEDPADRNGLPQIPRGPGVRVLQGTLGPVSRAPAPPPESEAVQMFRIQQQMSSELLREYQGMTAGVFAELRASQQQLRIDLSGALQAQAEAHSAIMVEVKELVHEMRTDLGNARDEVTKANQRLVKMTEHTSSHFQGQAEANKQGWEAFRAGMQMQLQAMNQNLSWERQMMFMQFENLAKEKNTIQVEERNTPSWVKDYGPLIIAAVGQVAAAKGVPGAAELSALAMQSMFSDDEDEEEEEDDEEEAEAEDAPKKKPKKTTVVMGMDAKSDARAHFEKNKVGSMLHLFDSMLDDEQRKTLKKLLPSQAWHVLQDALKANNEALVKAYLIQFIAFVKQVPGLDDELTAAMNKEQVELFNDIAELISSSLPGQRKKKKQQSKTIIDVEATPQDPPPPPPAPPKPPSAQKASETAGAGSSSAPPDMDKCSVADLKKWAKKTYPDIKLPKNATRTQVKKAIEDQGAKA